MMNTSAISEIKEENKYIYIYTTGVDVYFLGGKKGGEIESVLQEYRYMLKRNFYILYFTTTSTIHGGTSILYAAQIALR